MNRAKVVGRVGVLAVAGLASAASAGFTNGGFEGGTLANWTSNSSTRTSVVAFAEGVPFTAPVEGTKFARVISGVATNQYTTLTSDPFNMAPGQVLSGNFYFHSFDINQFQEDGYVRLLDSSNSVVATLITRNFSDLIALNRRNTGWLPFDFTAAGSLTGLKLQVGVRNVVNNQLDSIVGVDNIQLSALTIIPLPTGVGIAAAGLFAVGIRRSRTARI